MTDRLTTEELRRWGSWKRAGEAVLDRVGDAILDASGLSVPDFSVLTRLVEEGGGTLRQQRLSDDLRWGRSRLSRHLGRMEGRGLVERSGTVTAREITATSEGKRLVAIARSAHAVAVRKGLMQSVPEQDAEVFWATVGLLADGRPTSSG